jgi:hypothetical protein
MEGVEALMALMRYPAGCAAAKAIFSKLSRIA